LAGSIARYTTMQTKLGTQRTTLTTQQDALRTRLVTQFAHSNSIVAGSKSTLTYLQNQATSWSYRTS
jgi:flagellar capping protein FliD